MTRGRSLSTLFTAVLVFLAGASVTHSDDPVTSAVTFNREIIRIFERKCLACHSPGGIAMSLVSHREVRPWARAIREEIIEQRMPPWSAAPGYTRLQNELPLTPRELSTVLTWLDGGLPKGEESDLPDAQPHDGPDDLPDRTIQLPTQQVPGGYEDVVRRLTVEPGVAATRWVRRVQLRPGSRNLVRAGFVFVTTEGQEPVLAGAWTPTHRDIAPPVPSAIKLPKGARLSIEMHYRGDEEASVDTSVVELFWAPAGDWRETTTIAVEQELEGKPQRRAQITLAQAARLWSILPQGWAEGASLEVIARQPDGHVTVLLWVPQARSEWPTPFVLYEPATFPAGTVISVSAAQPTGAARTLLTVHPINSDP